MLPLSCWNKREAFLFSKLCIVPPPLVKSAGGIFFSVLAKCPTYFLRKFLKKKVGALALVLCIEGNICVPDTLGACGANKTNCSLLPGWRAGKCDAGVCVATACRTGFCLTPYGQCTNAQSNSTCGIDGGACQFCNIKQVCSAGSCVDKQIGRAHV